MRNERSRPDHSYSAARAKKGVRLLNAERQSCQKRLRELPTAPFAAFVFKNIATHVPSLTAGSDQREVKKKNLFYLSDGLAIWSGDYAADSLLNRIYHRGRQAFLV